MLVCLKKSFFILHTFFYASEAHCKEPNVEKKLELDRSQLSNLVAECKDILTSVGKLLASYTAKVDSAPELPVLVEPDIIDEVESEVVTELVSLQENISP